MQHSTTTVQELRKDPVGFLRKVNKGKTMTVIYRSKPFATIRTASEKHDNPQKNIQRMLEYAELARSTAKNLVNPSLDYKTTYHHDEAKKHGLS